MMTYDDTIEKEFKKAKYRVMNDPDIVERLHGNHVEKEKINKAFKKMKRKICSNIKKIKKHSNSGYSQFVKNRLKFLDNSIDLYSAIQSCPLFCK
jgi:uncharacterized OsmC-like protein